MPKSTVVDSVLAHIDKTCPCCGKRIVMKAYISLFRKTKVYSVCCGQPVTMMINNGRIDVRCPIKQTTQHHSKHNILMGNHF